MKDGTSRATEGGNICDRQWGTVREDYYSESGDARDYFTHDEARSRAYRWGEDGLAGIFNGKRRFCLFLMHNEKREVKNKRVNYFKRR